MAKEITLSAERRKQISEQRKAYFARNGKKVFVNGILYDTMQQASRAVGIDPATLKRRAVDPEAPNHPWLWTPEQIRILNSVCYEENSNVYARSDSTN